ncbi:Response regulator receiver domain-containing protein [Chitinophaga jiangningensis]|uniref:Response regulator receiver domain-containing protein n=1 Tax=Chitinophaga jiangningensis TaxID=1419482 RepID=A0A1M7H2B5_9BACT|nr:MULTISPECIES: response regulator [Chitinophaga]MBV7532636.1 response regulator [Chitinophaga sp. sic0106]SHM22661.1 Response regulator receiver domain-containing protein [Chitinophaga jiangningensis]
MNSIPDLRVILIDDNEIDLLLHEKLITLQQISRTVLSFLNANKALEFLSSNISLPRIPPTIILLDIQMPEMDGFEFLQAFDAYPQKIKSQCHIIMVSSTLDYSDITRSNANPLVTKLLRKPLLMKELRDAVEGIFKDFV